MKEFSDLFRMKKLTPKQALKWGSIAGGGILLLLLLLAGLLLAPIWDIPPVDDSEMRFTRVEIPEEENAFPLFRKAFEALEAAKPERAVWREWGHSPEEHAEEIQEWFRQHPEILDIFQEGLARGNYQTPEIHRYEDEIPWVSENLDLSRLIELRIQTETNPQLREAWLMDLFRFAALCHSAGDTLIETLVAQGVLQTASRTFLEDLYAERYSADSLRRNFWLLQEIDLNPERLLRTFQSEYRAAVHALAEEVPKAGLDSIHNGEESSSFWLILLHRPHSWTYQPNRTRLLLMENTRVTFAVIRGEAGLDTLPLDIDPRFFLPDRSLRSYLRFSHNAIGKLFFQIIVPASRGVVTNHRNQEAQLQALRILCALRLYHLEQGRLPDSLSDLVPEFFEAVPLDPFDGQPFRYLPEQALIYSVGRNGIDHGGSIRPLNPRDRQRNLFQTEDMVFGIFEPIDLEAP